MSFTFYRSILRVILITLNLWTRDWIRERDEGEVTSHIVSEMRPIHTGVSTSREIWDESQFSILPRKPPIPVVVSSKRVEESCLRVKVHSHRFASLRRKIGGESPRRQGVSFRGKVRTVPLLLLWNYGSGVERVSLSKVWSLHSTLQVSDDGSGRGRWVFLSSQWNSFYPVTEVGVEISSPFL